MKPSIGRIVHVNLPDIGWRPMMVTSFRAAPTADPGAPSHYLVSGWAKLDPGDLPDEGSLARIDLGGKLVYPNEIKVTDACEGILPDKWRWPPRV